MEAKKTEFGDSTNNPRLLSSLTVNEIKEWEKKIKIIERKMDRESTEKNASAYHAHIRKTGKVPIPRESSYDILYDYNNGQSYDTGYEVN